MTVLTGRQLKETSLGKVPAPPPVGEALDIPAEPDKSEALPGERFRMYHPDDPTRRMKCKIVFMDTELEIEKGAVIVEKALADALEQRGWLRGAMIKEGA